MNKSQKVHIRDASGKVIYTNLWDEKNICRFDSYGFVDKLTIEKKNWSIHPGWVKLNESR